MKKIRVIARLDVKGPNVVKGIQFECLRVMGKPKDLAENYYLQGADELIYLDIVANLYRRQNLVHIIDQTSDNIFIPFTVGGGVRSLEDIRIFLEAGADKVAVNTAATKDPELIREAAKMFGSQCIVSSIEAKRQGRNKWEAYVDNGRQSTGLDVIEWAKRVEELGAGEILLTSVDMEGTETGFDLELVKKVTSVVSIPVIASGGAGSINDFVQCFRHSNPDAIAVASLLHYNKCDVGEIKEALCKEGFDVRTVKGIKKISKGPDQKYDIEDYNKYTLKHLKYRGAENEPWKGKINTNYQRTCTKDSEISVIDYEINNVKSVLKAFEKIGKNARIINTPEEILAAKCLVLPGVGAFKNGMRQMVKKGYIEPLQEKVKSGTPLLGICLGMQLLFSESEEFGRHKGLDLIKGKVVSLRNSFEIKMKGYKLPHMGWNELKKPNAYQSAVEWEETFLKDIETGSCVYFAHSFYPIVDDPSNVVATTVYGGQEFCVVVKKDNISGIQFHPEKSGSIGLNILKNFCEINGI